MVCRIKVLFPESFEELKNLTEIQLQILREDILNTFGPARDEDQKLAAFEIGAQIIEKGQKISDRQS